MCRDESIVFIICNWCNNNVFIRKFNLKQIYFVALFVLISTNCNAYDYDQWNQDVEDSGYDWVIHTGVGAVTSIATITLLPDDWDRWIKYACGIAASLVVGGIIESFDKNWNNQDFWEYGYGGVGGAVIMLAWDVDWATMTFKQR